MLNETEQLSKTFIFQLIFMTFICYIEHTKSFIVYLLNCFSVNISAMFDKNALSSKTMAVFVLFVSVCLLQETWLKC